MLHKFWNDTRGATAIEYGLIASGIAVAIIAIVTQLGGDLANIFGKVDAGLVNNQ